jgi:ankyrin repeat protein
MITPARSDISGTKEVVPTNNDLQWANDLLSVNLEDANHTPELHALNHSLLSPSPILASLPSLEHCAHGGATFENTNIEHNMPDGKVDKISWTDEDYGFKLPSLRGFNTLHIASHKGQAGIIRMLLATKSHLDVDSMTGDGRSALHVAALAEHAEVVQELLRAGANALLRDSEGQTAMHMAARSGNIAVARQILNECSECLLLRDNNMQTPLHQAVIQGHEKMVMFLLEKGADPAAVIL